MPVDWNKGEERYNWELLFCEMYAGGKYGEGEDNYEFSLGLNGLGLCATQYASAWMTADIYRAGFHYHLDCQKGENVGDVYKRQALESRLYFFSISEGSGSGRSSAWGRSWRTHLAMALLVSPSVWG